MSRFTTLYALCLLALIPLACSGDDTTNDPTGSGTLKVTGLQISGDTNADGLLQPGESATVTITLGNSGQQETPAMLGAITSGNGITISCGAGTAIAALQPGGSANLLGTDCGDGSSIHVQASPDAATGAVSLTILLQQGSDTLTLNTSLSITASDVPPSDLSVSLVTVSGDNSGDGFLNPGEQATVTVFVKNNGQSTISGLSGSVSTSNSAVTIDCGQTVTSLWFADIGPGQTMALAGSQQGCTTMGSMNISLGPGVAVDDVITFDLNLGDSAGAQYRLRATVTVMEPGGDITISETSILADSNGDGLVNPGEAVTVSLKVQNSGSSYIEGLQGVVTVEGDAASIDCGQVVRLSHKDGLDPGQSDYLAEFDEDCYSDGSFTFSVGSGVSGGTPLNFRLALSDAQNNSYAASFSLTVMEISGAISVSVVDILDDSNADGFVNRGETASLNLKIKNDGDAQLNGLGGTISTSSQWVTITCGQVVIAAEDTLHPGYESYLREQQDDCYTNGTMKIEVDREAPFNTQAPFTVTLVDELDDTYTAGFTVAILKTGASISAALEIRTSSNGDATISAGESADFNVSITNTGTSRLNNCTGTISTESPFASVECGAVVLLPFDRVIHPGYTEDLDDRQEGCSVSMGALAMRVDPTTPANTQIPVTVRLVDTEGNDYEAQTSFTTGVHGGQLVFDRYEIVSDVHGTTDVLPGGHPQIKVYLRNDGDARITPLWGTVELGGDHAVIDCGTSVKSAWDRSIEPGDDEYLVEDQPDVGCSGSFRLQVSDTAPVGAQIPVTLHLQDAQQHPWPVSFNIEVHAP